MHVVKTPVLFVPIAKALVSDYIMLPPPNSREIKGIVVWCRRYPTAGFTSLIFLSEVIVQKLCKPMHLAPVLLQWW